MSPLISFSESMVTYKLQKVNISTLKRHALKASHQANFSERVNAQQ